MRQAHDPVLFGREPLAPVVNEQGFARAVGAVEDAAGVDAGELVEPAQRLLPGGIDVDRTAGLAARPAARPPERLERQIERGQLRRIFP